MEVRINIRPRVPDLAASVGVSISTVSRVLNGKSGIRENTHQTMLQAMADLGYDREKLRQRTGMVGVMVPELSNPSFPTFAERLDAMFRPIHRVVIAAVGPLGANESSYIVTLLDPGVDGVISISSAAVDTKAGLAPYLRPVEARVPTVSINGYTTKLAPVFVNCSDVEAAAASVTHLRSLEYERIGLAIGPARFLPTQRKSSALLGLGFGRGSIERTIFTPESDQVAVARLLATGYTAIIRDSDLMVLGVTHEARSRESRVLEGPSVIGFDDFPLIAFIDPPLTTARQSIQAMCETVVPGLMRAMNDNAPGGTELVFWPDLIIRQPTGPRT